jgi:hypothetical protein
MKLVKFAPIALLLVLSVTAVMASHTATVSISPTEIPAEVVRDISLKIMNSGMDNIVMVELVIPESDQKPIFLVEDVITPQGWTYSYATRLSLDPYRIIWSTEGSGIAKDKTLGFGLTMQTPSEMGNYEFDWKTTDTKGGVQSGVVTMQVGQATVSGLKVTTGNKVSAGSSLTVSVTAYDSSGKIKSDYKGTVTFSSTDEKAILPATYTFTPADNGNKKFIVKLKTAGKQTVSVEDKANKFSATSNIINVGVGKIVSVDVVPEEAAVNSGEEILFSAIANDLYGNQLDVTNQAIWNIDSGAGGKWKKSLYTAANHGIWTVKALYLGLSGGAELLVAEGLITEVPVEEEIPIEEEIIPPVEEVPETPIAALSITGDDSIAITPGGNDTMILTVNNDGDTELTGVEIGVAGVPSDWVLIFPLSSDIDAGNSKDYLIIIYVPENETEAQTMTFTATSTEGATAEKEVALSFGVPATGLLEAIPQNILQLGVVIIAVAAVVIIGWELWFKK